VQGFGSLPFLFCGLKFVRVPYFDFLLLEHLTTRLSVLCTFESIQAPTLQTASRVCVLQVDATKQIQLLEVPDVLSIQLKRFAFGSMFGGHGAKIGKHIAFPDQVGARVYVCTP
jgi:hypothetical protein